MPELKLLPQKTNYELIEKQSRLTAAVKDLKKEPLLSLDIEGTSLDPYDTKLLLFQVATPDYAYVFDARHLDLKPLAKIISDEKILKLVQNAKFDYGMLKAKVGIEIRNIFDTMLAERILTTGITRENSLRAISRKYLGVELAKETRETFINHVRDFSKKQLEYAAADVLVLFPIYEAQKKALKKEGLDRIAQLEFDLVPAVAEMELKGFLINVKRWREVITDYKRKAREVAKKIQEELRPYSTHTQTDLFGNHADVVNLNSPSQILKAFRRVGLDLPSTGESVLSQYNHPLTKLLLEYRGYEKIITSFGENLLSKINKKTGRVHPDYMQIGADTGRFACSNPNLQQIPTDSLFRDCFIPAPGYKLVVADYSQIELRIMAELSKDPVFVKAFKENQDLHALTASQMFGIPIEKVNKDKRFQAKSINFGLMYGRGAKSLAVQLGVSEDESRRLLQRYFKRYHRVREWLDKVAKEAVRLGYSTTMGGRKRYYQRVNPGDPGYERQVAHIERQGKNTPIQGTSADMIKMALVYVRKRFREEGLDAVPIHTVHDEIVVEAREDHARETAKILEREMRRAGEEFLKTVPVKVDVVVSDVWEH
ncbi:MAG: bifunctional 3'-5' exonuclease/DNA polymerase [Patescibacteria group bacterium]|nr:MAG: bifunctional 3'-5' exonuclease/DNA polymerase [Patescibacteria group bacterium]